MSISLNVFWTFQENYRGPLKYFLAKCSISVYPVAGYLISMVTDRITLSRYLRKFPLLVMVRGQRLDLHESLGCMTRTFMSTSLRLLKQSHLGGGVFY